MASRRPSRSDHNKAIRAAASRGDPLFRLTPKDPETGLLRVFIDTPRESPIKFKYDIESRCYKASYLLQPGTVYPLDFGSIPSTLAEDGDPLDVLVLSEKPSFVGCLVLVRLLGVLEAEQTAQGETIRNDRLIGAAQVSREYGEVSSLDNVPRRLLDDVERFYVFYNQDRGRVFKVLRRAGPVAALRLIEQGQRRFRRVVTKRPSRG